MIHRVAYHASVPSRGRGLAAPGRGSSRRAARHQPSRPAVRVHRLQHRQRAARCSGRGGRLQRGGHRRRGAHQLRGSHQQRGLRRRAPRRLECGRSRRLECARSRRRASGRLRRSGRVRRHGLGSLAASGCRRRCTRRWTAAVTARGKAPAERVAGAWRVGWRARPARGSTVASRARAGARRRVRDSRRVPRLRGRRRRLRQPRRSRGASSARGARWRR